MTDYALPVTVTGGQRIATAETHNQEVNRAIGEAVMAEAARAGAAEVALSGRIDAIVATGAFVGPWAANSGAFPLRRPGGDPILAGDTWRVTAAGTVSVVSSQFRSISSRSIRQATKNSAGAVA